MSCGNQINGKQPVACDAALASLKENKNWDNWPLEKKKGKDGTDEVERVKQVIRFFRDNTNFPPEFVIGMVGVWSAESHVKPWALNETEKNSGGYLAGKHTGENVMATVDGKKYMNTEENMKLFGYGKGIAQWSWARPLDFAKWYNTEAAESVKTPGVPTIDTFGSALTSTNLTTQSAFALKEMSTFKYAFKQGLDSMVHSNPSTEEGFKKFEDNIIDGADLVLRGFENGGCTGKLASPKQMDAYKWDGGYDGSLKRRVGAAMNIYNALKDDPEFSQYFIGG